MKNAATATKELKIDQVSMLTGVPVIQLQRWAATGNGPKCEGNPYQPSRLKYRESDVLAWQDRMTRSFEASGRVA